MGIKISWQVPDTESTYNYVYIYRATSESGVYSQLASQLIADNTYYDMNGTTSHWYKVRFYDSVNILWSDYSTAIQGGFYGGYCSVDEVKEIAEIPSEITDIQLFKLIRVASLNLNHDIQTHIFREKIAYIDEVKTNDMDASNTTFYLQHYPIGDYNNDFKVTTGDVTVYKEYTDVNGDRLETTMTVSSVDQSLGKIVLSAAPDGTDELYATYCHTPTHFDVNTPNMMIKFATAYLAAFLAKSKVGDNNVSRYTIDRLTVVNLPEQVKSDYFRYIDLVDKIKGDLIEVGGEDVN
jgi:hypothetical protein